MYNSKCNRMKNQLERCDNQTQKIGSEIFSSHDEMQSSLARFCHGDLYVIGRIWIEAMKAVLVGTKMSLIPAVEAAAPPPPKKPPPMRYKDLCIYKSPHYEYKEYIEDLEKCPDYKVKLLHEYLLPYVKNGRRQIQQIYRDNRCVLNQTCRDICCSIHESKRELKKAARDPENLTLRRTVVASTAAIGYMIGSGRGIPRRLFFTGLGAFTGGALCFPKESDLAFRTLLYYTGKSLVAVYNATCGKQYNLRDRVPCVEDMPQRPVTARKEQCPVKK